MTNACKLHDSSHGNTFSKRFFCNTQANFDMKDVKAIKSILGLDPEKCMVLADMLNDLLANYQLFYINARGFHWNITGEKFFELHGKFEELYTDALLKIDEIAERIRTLEATPLHSFSAYLEQATIKEVTDVSDAKKAVEKILSALHTLIEKERKLLAFAEDAEDEGTVALMSEYIRQQEKLVWMYSSFLK